MPVFSPKAKNLRAAGLFLAAWLASISFAHAQTISCNDAGGFLKSSGPITLGDPIALGPNCQHAQDGQQAGVGVPATTSPVTITIASPGVVTWPSHNLLQCTPITFTTTGALPTPLAAIPALTNPTAVYALVLDANRFALATTPANCANGIALNTSGSQSGTQTAIANGVACAGCVGEQIWKTVPFASGFPLTTGSGGQTWNNISVPPGIWIVKAQACVLSSTAGVFTHMHAGFGNGIVSIPTSPGFGSVTADHLTSNNQNGWCFPEGKMEFSLAVTATMNANLTADFTNTAVAYGTIWAERIR